MNIDWLLQNADIPICYNLAHKTEDIEQMIQKSEAAAWLARLAERSLSDKIGDIHGSHDYRMENILGKCWILGLSKDISVFAEKMEFILSLYQFTRQKRYDIYTDGRKLKSVKKE